MIGGITLVYTAKSQRGYLAFILVITVLTMVRQLYFGTFEFDSLFYVQLTIVLFTLLCIFINFTIKINDHYLTYEILFLKSPIYKNVVHPEGITQIKFILVGWTGKGAVIKTKKGFNIRIGYSFSNGVTEDLGEFAKNNDISIYKTKEYLIIEK